MFRKITFEELFKKADATRKENFLMEILKENSFYRDKFQTLVLGQLEVESDNSVEEIRDTVKKEMEAFDLQHYERFYHNYNPAHGYRSEGQVLYDGASEELNNLMGKYMDSITECLRTGNIIDAAKGLLGFYEGILLVDEDKIEDTANIFRDGFVGELAFTFFDFMNGFVKQFQGVSKSEEALLRIAGFTVERLRFYRENSALYNGFEYDAASFRLFLQELICTPETARYWDTALEQMNLKNHSTDEVQLKIAEQLGDNKNWLKIAESTFKSNPVVAEKLLHFYKQQGDSDNFVRVGKCAFATWASKFDRYLYENLEKKEDPDFFSDILFHYAGREESIPLFKEYKKALGKKGAKQFIDKLKEDRKHRLYYIKLLEEEKDFASILQYVKDHIGNLDFIDCIEPVINIYPAECFKIIRDKTDDALMHSTGRGIYYEVVQWLKLLLKVKDKKIKGDIQRYFNSLFKTYNRRSVLKHELEKAGIFEAAARPP